MYKHPLQDREKMSPQEALTILLEGNQRFTQNISAHRDLLNVVNITKEKQHPFAAILSCSDSRTATELIFDQGLGDLFSVRLAGNIASRKAIGSLEYSCKYLGSKLIVVLGHTNCGAVKAACDGFTGGHIGEITKMIFPAVEAETETKENRSSANNEFVGHVCTLNVKTQIDTIWNSSDILRDMLNQGQIGIVGGVYDLATAEVNFPEQYQIFSSDHPLVQN
ncbi:carbonic anhydrase [Methylobacillus glycogenes]|uniref:carbonic anhydrase n=1 Tax=Methylobacillus glycogenes TaxID=406 RepID=UPI0004717F16|nr:carbonic anhydrase [Methylobacillus glycogenes]MBL8506231.1 carbonic anhydrase [Methylobacillus glycogenes]